MMELIQNAAAGWLRFNQNGKYAVLLLAVLLYLWYTELLRRQGKEPESESNKAPVIMVFLQFTTLTAALAAVPVTAAVLMMYQTKFYDYEWIWSVVPVTAMTAFGMTVVYTGCYEKYWKNKLLKPAAFAALGLALLALCGNLQGSWYRTADSGQQEEKTGKILDELNQNGNTKDICIWAPRVIMESVRALDGNVTMPYGRNMWDDSLNAYSYDTYGPELVKLYEWMENAAAMGDGLPAENMQAGLEAAAACAQTALEYGVNRILIPESVPAQVRDKVKGAAEVMGFTVTLNAVEGYVIFSMDG